MNEKPTENPNAQDYNPNRPQSTSGGSHQDTQKVVDTVAQGAAEYLAPGIGGKAYNAAKSAPVIGDQIAESTSKVAETADKIPGVQKAAQGLNQSGITDAAQDGIDKVSSSGGLSSNSPTNMSPNSKDNSPFSSPTITHNRGRNNGVSTPSSTNHLNFRKNSTINNRASLDSEDETLYEDSIPNENEELPNDTTSVPSDSSVSNTPNNNSEEPNSETSHDVEKKNQKNILWEILKRNPWLWGIIGAIIMFIFILFIGIMQDYSNNNENLEGYYESTCNINETYVTLTNCYDNDTNKEILTNLSLEDYVLGATYAYTKGDSYNDETLKALMITLKTNALSYGEYNGSTQEVSIKSCSINNNYCDIEKGCYLENEGYYSNTPTYKIISEENNDKENIISPASESYKSKLKTIYNEISSYLFISESYTSAIASLNSNNSLKFDADTLKEMEELALNNKKYGDILTSIYNDGSVENIETTTTNENLFLGDSRTQGILNTGVTNDNNTVYAVSGNYNWMTGAGDFSNYVTNSATGGIVGINKLIDPNKSYNIIIWMGCNDLNNVNNYYNKFVELAEGDWARHQLYIVSVGPVKDSVASVTNESINNFNNTMRELIASGTNNNIHYIDLNYTETSVNTYDHSGLHYGSEDYKKIYNIMLTGVGQNISSKKAIYNFTDYCTYYNYSNNDAWWWPIGSKEATPTGSNIYGGEVPTRNLKINSPFGYRYIFGEYKHHGGIDIAGDFGDIVIAAKDGVVTEIYNGCATIGGPNNSCGGYRGNKVVVDHNGVTAIYQHLTKDSIVVKVGDQVKQGQKLALVGSSGSSSGAHLHFEIQLSGAKVDPLNYVSLENPRPVNMSSSGLKYAGNPNDGQNFVCSTFTASGFNKNATIGIMVNMRQESSFIPTNLQNHYESTLGYTDATYTSAVDSGQYSESRFVHDSAGYGLVQWTHWSLKQFLYNNTKKKGKSIGDIYAQMDTLYLELQDSSEILNYLQGNHTSREMAKKFCNSFERPGNYNNPDPTKNSCELRINNYLTSMTNYVNNGCKGE